MELNYNIYLYCFLYNPVKNRDNHETSDRFTLTDTEFAGRQF